MTKPSWPDLPPRYPQAGRCTPLGCYGEFDLYLCEQTLLPPTLIARYGNRPEDYLSFNPNLVDVSVLDTGPDCEMTRALRTALERARAIGRQP